jgi:hypothetical protein
MTAIDKAPSVPADLAPALIADHLAVREADQQAQVAVLRLRAVQAGQTLRNAEALAAVGLHPADGWHVEHADGEVSFAKEARGA